MRARLTVTSDQRQSLGAEASRDFPEVGGFIGRSATCDWRLPDPSHTVSARHAEIRFNGHGFVVVDLSTNGVYVNTTDAPLGRGNSAVLVTGDTLYVGVYVIAVEVLRTEAAQRPHSGVAPGAGLGELPAASPRLDTPWQTPAARPAATYRPASTPRQIDPLAALDGAESAPEGDNPFQELGLVRKSGETTTGWRDLLDSRSRPAPATPQPYAPPAPAPRPAAPPYPAAVSPPPAPGTTAVIPADFALNPIPGAPVFPPQSAGGNAVPPAAPWPSAPLGGPLEASAYPPVPLAAPPPAQNLAPPIPAPAFAPVPPAVGLSEGGIPPGFLDELSVLIPQLTPRSPVSAENLRPPAAAPEAPLAISRGVSTRTPPEPGLAAADPVSLLRQRAAARGGTVGQTLPTATSRLPAALALGDERSAAPREAPPIPRTPLPGPPLPPMPPEASAAGGDPAEPLWALLGLDGPSLSLQARAMLFADVAGLLREMADGLVSVLEARRLIKDGFNLDQTQLRPVENNPFKFCSSGREALDKALVKRSPGFLAPADAARAGFADVKVHEMAAMEAMQATIARLLQRVSPAAVTFELEGEAAGNASLFARKLDKGRLWDRYLAMHERLVDALDVISPEVVGEEFARAYAHHSQDLRRRDP
ncbi:type VI secretion system-associated FHA domain protein TagH [Azorhizobium sp. AG788]|uniref:type VI secretion system-associated FHA domain protein TagH n=1 Tax=Azorhizobium sp. AG788 TaxID=2183897 RepID=UPI003139A5E8